MKTKILVIASMLMIVAMSWMLTASAWDKEGVETVDGYASWAQPIEFFSGDYITVSYTITVQNDAYIDIILLNEKNYNLYKEGEAFSYNAEGTDFNTVYKKVTSIIFYEHDNYYIVVDNTYKPSEGADPDNSNDYCTFHYTISANAHHPNSGGGGSTTTWEDDEGDSPLLGILCVSVTGILIIIVVGAVLYDKQKKQKAQQQQPPQPYYQERQPPPPGYQPPQQPY